MNPEDLDLPVEAEEEAEIEAAWIQEAERRLAAYKAGEIEVISAEEVFAEARRRLREGH